VTEDELRAMFARRADDVAPPDDLLDRVRARARRIRRRRGIAATSLAVAALTLAPVAVLQKAAVPGRDGATAATRPVPRPAPWLAASPHNRLSWPARGRAAPPRFQAAVRTWLARDAARHADVGSRTRTLPLWSGSLPDGRWATLLQAWNPGDPRRARAWSTLLFAGGRDGGRLAVPYDLPTRFTHAGRGRGGGVGRIAGYGFDLGDAVVVVGAPRATTAAVTDGRRTVHRPLAGGAAVFRVPPGRPYRLFRLTGPGGATLTPDDRHPGGGHGWHLDLTS